MTIQQESKPGTTRNRPLQIYMLLIFSYFLAVGASIYFMKGASWIVTGFIIGGIYVFVSFYYFYDHFLSPYVKEAQEKRSPELTVKKGSIMSITRPNIYIWMLQWTLPAIALQVFIILGFWLTLAKSPFVSSIYTHPYVLGKIYKNIDTINPALEGAKSLNDMDLAKLKAQYETIENTFSGYLKDYQPVKNKEDMKVYVDSIKGEVELKIYKIPFLIAFAFGFMGTLIYTLTDTADRFNSSDLYPKTFINYVIRFIFAPALCLVIAYFMMNDWWINAAPLLFFFVGFFPQRAMQYIEERATKLLSLKQAEEKKEIPLGMIQGMTDYIVYRFREIGVADAQNLANVDLSTLRSNLGFSDRQICDFVAQAILLIYLKEHFSQMQAFGIRNIISFKTMIDDMNYEQIAKLLSIPPEKLLGLLKVIRAESVSKRIETLEIIIKEADERERTRRTAGISQAAAPS